MKGAAALSAVALAANSAEAKPRQAREIYELRVYTLKQGGAGTVLISYFQEALIPALNRQGIARVGLFKEMADPLPQKIYLLIPHPSFQAMGGTTALLAGDQAYQEAARPYHSLPLARQPYLRHDTWLMEAFGGIPQMAEVPVGPRVFELRTYEGFSSDAVRRKVEMFDKEELALFYQVKLNPVFFGLVVAGPNMPALTYMLHFKDMEERAQHWKTFIDHPEWKRMSALPEYADTVSHIARVFLEPMAGSQV